MKLLHVVVEKEMLFSENRTSPTPVVNFTMHVKDLSLRKMIMDVIFLWKEERICLLISSSGSSSTLSYSSEHSSPNSYSSGTTPPQNHHSRTLISRGCSNCKHLLGKTKVLEAAVEMHMHPEQHTRTNLAKITKKQSKPNKIEHEIEKNAQKPDSRSTHGSKWIATMAIRALLLQLLNDSRTIDEMLKQREQAANLEYLEHSSNTIAPILPTEEPEYSLNIGYEHLSTNPKTESDEVIKSSAKNLLPIPSEYEVAFDDESECDVPIKDESSPVFTTFLNPLFDCNDDFTSSDDESLSDEDVPIEDFKVYSNPLFDDEEINIDPHYFNAESNLIESLSNRDTLFDSSPKFDYLKEFSGELMSTSIVNEERIRKEHEEYISLSEKLFSINSFPRPLENFHANTIVKTLPTSTIPVGDGDSLREEIDIFTGTNDLLPPAIESDDYDSEEELLGNDSISLPENKSSNFDHLNDPSFPRPPPEPPDVEFFFDLEPDLISVVMNNIDELNEDECFDPGGEIDVFVNIEDDDYFPFIFVIRIFLPYLIYPEVFPLFLSVGSEDTIFDPGIST
uniref:Uncharacterized protein n=1 Tax=Tanacetum cinerariifolium TaxID=118510 RepID=A0A6L2L9R2_TANCI|nr:hypothetical protein [Tanacetum cinerariifolium]